MMMLERVFTQPVLDEKMLMREFFDQVWNQGNLNLIDELFDPEYIGHTNNAPDTIGPEAIKLGICAYRTAFPDLHFEIEEQIAEGDTVVTRWSACGKNQHSLPHIHATAGHRVTLKGVTINRFAWGKCIESWDHWDNLSVFQQLDAVPAFD